jgi:hypothetical protein
MNFRRISIENNDVAQNQYQGAPPLFPLSVGLGLHLPLRQRWAN